MSEVKSTRGRKKKAETKTYKMQFLIEESIKDELEKQAEDIGLELKDYVRWILTQRAKNIEVRTQVVDNNDNREPRNYQENNVDKGSKEDTMIGFKKEKIKEINQSTEEKTIVSNVTRNSMFGPK